MSNIGSVFGLDPGSSKDDRKQALMQTIRHEASVENARMLIEKINEKCFEKCVPKPGSSLSAGESVCLTNCLQKYMAAWNVVSAAYIARIKTDPAL